MATKAQLLGLVKTKGFAVTVTGVISLAAGASAGYLVAKNQLQAAFDLRLDDEIEKAKEYYQRNNKTGEFASPMDAVEHLHRDVIVVEEGYTMTEGEVEEQRPEDVGVELIAGTEVEGDELLPKEVRVVKDVRVLASEVDRGKRPLVEGSERRNVFADARSANSAFDYDVEVPLRTDDVPYVITFDEFVSNETELEQASLTYFKADDVLIDAMDNVIDDHGIVGEINLTRFGFGSNSKHTVYVRNVSHDIEFEITESDGDYTSVVLGVDLRHSDDRAQMRKFRDTDD